MNSSLHGVSKPGVDIKGNLPMALRASGFSRLLAQDIQYSVLIAIIRKITKVYPKSFPQMKIPTYKHPLPNIASMNIFLQMKNYSM